MVLLFFMPLDTSADTYRLPLLPSVSDALREGMVRIGTGQGDWRLVLDTSLDIEPLAPDSGLPDGSAVRLINPSEGAAQIEIRAWDDAGDEAPEGAVSLSLASGASTSLSAESLQDGARGLSGSFGEGEGGWRLAVQADRGIQVMSLVEDTAGHLTNLSTSSTRPWFLDPCVGGPEDADGDGVSDHCDSEPDTARTLERCGDGSYVTDPDRNPGLVSDCRGRFPGSSEIWPTCRPWTSPAIG